MTTTLSLYLPQRSDLRGLEPLYLSLFVFMILEISYSYKEDKYSTPEISWTYYSSKSDDLKEAIGEAGKHFKRFVTANGWGKKATLQSISTLKHESTPPDHRIITPDPPQRRSTQQRKKSSSSSRTSSPQSKNRKNSV